jgi:hypothetical protein
VKIKKIVSLTKSKIAAGNIAGEKSVQKAFSSDLMSDVLTLDEEHVLLISGLANIQLVRTAEMAEIDVVLLARNKKATSEMIDLANDTGLIILETPFSIYRASGILYSNGLEPVY